MSRDFYSYVTLPDEAVQIEWSAYDMKIPENGLIKQWKKNDDLDIGVYLILVQDQLKSSVIPGSDISINFYWHSPKGREGSFIHGCSKRIKYIPDNTSNIMEIYESFTIDGTMIAGAIEVSCAIVVDSCPKIDRPTIYAREKGSVIYKSSIILTLEGTQALFPVAAVDFSELTNVANDSLYFLKRIYSQLDSNFNSAYKLYFNSKHPLFSAINSNNENDETAQYLLKLIMYDVYRTIVVDALSENGLQEIFFDEKEAFSLRSIYSKLIMSLQENSVLMNKDLDSLKKMMNSGSEEDRNAIFTAIQAYIME